MFIALLNYFANFLKSFQPSEIAKTIPAIDNATGIAEPAYVMKSVLTVPKAVVKAEFKSVESAANTDTQGTTRDVPRVEAPSKIFLSFSIF